jgi:hypothetical protein
LPGYWSFINLDPNPFTTPHPWYCLRNFFSLQLNDGLAQLEESGIYKMWERKWDIYRRVKLNPGPGIPRFAALLMQWQTRSFWRATSETGDDEDEDVPISFESVQLIFLIYGVMLLVSVVVAVVEITDYIRVR